MRGPRGQVAASVGRKNGAHSAFLQGRAYSVACRTIAAIG
jgi:hypothetical protein